MSRRIPDEDIGDGKNYFRHMLWSRKMRATPGRMALLRELEKTPKPLSIAELHATLPSLNDASIYRAIEALVEGGLVDRIDTGTAHSSYELALGRSHHHHLICTSCGDIEDVKDCLEQKTEQRVLATSKKFSSLSRHALEFFGMCNKCEK